MRTLFLLVALLLIASTTHAEVKLPPGHLVRLNHDIKQPARNWVSCVAVSPDGTRIATGSTDKNVRLFSADGKLLHTMSGHGDGVGRLAFSPDGKWLASTAYWDPKIRVWNVATGAKVAELQSVGKPMLDVAFSPNGQEIAACGYFHEVPFWSTQDWMLRRVLTDDPSSIHSRLAFHPDGKTIAVSDYSNRVSTWDLRTDRRTLQFSGSVRHASFFGYSANGRLLGIKGSESLADFWYADRLPNQAGPFPKDGWGGPWQKMHEEVEPLAWGRLPLPVPSVSQVGVAAFDPSGQYFLSNGDYFQSTPCGNLELFEIATGAVAWSITGVPMRVYDMAIFPDGKRAVIVGSNCEGYVVDLTHGIAPSPKRIVSDLWSDLASADSKKAYTARCELRSRRAESLDILGDLPEAWSQLEPALLLLDDDRERERLRANSVIMKLGRRALPTIQGELQKKNAPQRAERLETLRKAITAAPPPDATLKTLRELRFADIRVAAQTPAQIRWCYRLSFGDDQDPLTQLYRGEMRRQWKK